MQYFRLLPALVAIALCSLPLFARADDTPAQAAARAAMEDQMNQMNNGQTNLPAAAPAPAPEVATNAPAPAPEETETPPATMPATNQMTETPPPAPAPAPEETETPPATMPATNQMTESPAPAETNTSAAPVPQVTVSPQLATPEQLTNETTMYPVNPGSASSSQANIAPITVPPVETQTSTVLPTTASSTSTNTVQATKSSPSPTAQSEATINAPPLPISAEQQAELQQLLSQYMANQISPVQYQEQRAKILAGP